MPDLAVLIDPEIVRGLIRPGMPASLLPDPVVTRKVNTSLPIAEVKAADAQAESREGPHRELIASALNKLVAAGLLPSVALPEKEDFGDGGGFTLQKVDREKRAEELRRQAFAEIAIVVGNGATEFTTAPAFIVVE